MTSKSSIGGPAKEGYSTKFKGSIAFLVLLGILDLRYILDLIAYTKEHKPNDDFVIKDFSSFWVTLVGSVVLMTLQHLYEVLTK